MGKLKIGIIGAGGMASYHLAGFRQAGADVVAVTDNNLERSRFFAQVNGIGFASSSLDGMLDVCPDLQAVSIVTPNKFHMPLAVEALSKGLHVYCEKPPALNAGQMQRMLDASKAAGKVLMFDFNNRARPESRAMFRYIEQGDIGTINSAQATWIRRAGIPGFGGWFTNKELSGGGPVIDLLHMMDLALYLMQYPDPDYVMARTYDDFMGNPAFKGPWGIADVANGKTDVESACHAFVTFKTNQCLMVRNSWAEMNEREVASVAFQGSMAGGRIERLFGRDGIDETSIDSCRLFTEENGMQVNREVLVPRDETMGRVESAVNFVQTIEKSAQPLNTPDQALKLMKIIDAMYASAQSGKPVQIK